MGDLIGISILGYCQYIKLLQWLHIDTVCHPCKSYGRCSWWGWIYDNNFLLAGKDQAFITWLRTREWHDSVIIFWVFDEHGLVGIWKQTECMGCSSRKHLCGAGGKGAILQGHYFTLIRRSVVASRLVYHTPLLALAISIDPHCHPSYHDHIRIENGWQPYLYSISRLHHQSWIYCNDECLVRVIRSWALDLFAHQAQQRISENSIDSTLHTFYHIFGGLHKHIVL
jgi:hypothetical protein